MSSTTARRRQKHSCDQCRHGKRACDAGSGMEYSQQACTHCQRTNKYCTFEWLKSVEPNRLQDRKRKRGVESPQSNSTDLSPSSLQPRNNASWEQNSEDYSVFPSDWNLPQNLHSDAFTDLISLDAGQGASDDYDLATSPSIVTSHYASHPSENASRNRAASASANSNRRHSTARRQSWGELNTQPSPVSNWDLGETTSRRFMTDGLLRIYHDSMENALSCWLTEHNCPYTMVRQRKKHVVTEWGTMWSNRMHSRVCNLDRAYASVRTLPLTRKQEHMASHALNLAILAFSSQWAQAGERGASSEFGPPADIFPQSDMFGRSMQETLWHQASQVLHEAAGIESFRVVFALIIFSLTQRPLDMARSPPYKPTSPSCFQDLQHIIEGDEAPLFLEMALRQVYSFRRKLECLEREHSDSEESHNPKVLQQENRQTFNLLYWLGVMFDTLSAAMCHRPLVVEDEDSDLPPAKADESTHLSQETNQQGDWTDFETIEETNLPNSLWGDRFMTSNLNPTPTRWPCPYSLAASTLSSAAPVKVLLFRRVARLQTLLSRSASSPKLERAIHSTFQVYNHWNAIYNPFMLSCVSHHDSLPARIQSWYILLAGHWHLATFLFSSLLSTIDENSLSLPTERMARQSTNLVLKLERENAIAVANLSRSSLHRTCRSFQNSPDFHFALNKAALLTEPWTVVLIRSLSRAGFILAELAGKEGEGEGGGLRDKCGDCIQALWFLGRKSDMAFLAARFLERMLREGEEREKDATSTSYSDNGNRNNHNNLPSSPDFAGFFPGNIDTLNSPEIGTDPFLDPMFNEIPLGYGNDFPASMMGGMFDNSNLHANLSPLFA